MTNRVSAERIFLSRHDYHNNKTPFCLLTFFLCAVSAANAADDDGQYNWYKYDVKDGDDINEVCTVLNQKEGAYTWSYDMETSGTWYERDSKGQIASKDSAARTSSAISIAPAIICVLVTICVFVVGGAAFLIRRRQKYAESSESVYSGGTMV